MEAAGRPRNTDHPAWKLYKLTEGKLRSLLLRHLRQKKCDKFFASLDTNVRDSRKLFLTIRQADGATASNTNQLIRNQIWKAHFQDLATPSSSHEYGEFHTSVTREYQHVSNLASSNPIAEEVSPVVSITT